MENGSFQAPFSEISSLEFNEIFPPTPAAVPRPHETRTKSSTVEALLAQNEDLMARLKVSLRRLTTLEDENDHLRAHEQQTRTQNSSLSDQLLVWKEKENFWQQKIDKLETEMLAIRNRFPELEAMEEKIERYKKYHEKVRLQVKPYIQQLKAFAENLTLEIRKLNAEIEDKEIRRQEVERKIRDLRTEVDEQLRRQDDQNRHLVQIFETDKDHLRQETSELRRLNSTLETKAERLDQALMRQDELENMIIALRRSKEESDVQHREELRRRNEESQALRKAAVEDTCRLEDLTAKSKADREEGERQRHRADQLEEQLTSLRFLWSTNCEEMEKLQTRLRSLEKLNLDLSQRLNQARKGEASL